MFRAAHQLFDRPVIFDDPLALRIIGRAAEAGLRGRPGGFKVGAEVRAFLALRSWYAEEGWARAVGGGVRQCVILGAGLDTFAYRNPFDASGVRVFEVDHPATQAWKRQRLAEAEIAIPNSLAFVPIDFATQSLSEGLARAGFDARQPALFSMLGLVIFMPAATVMRILEFVAACPSPSGVVLDYGIKQSALTAEQLKIRMAAARASAAIGEPFLTFFDPTELTGQLTQMGFTKIDDFGCAEANARYFQNRADGLTVGTSGRRIVGAWKMGDE